MKKLNVEILYSVFIVLILLFTIVILANNWDNGETLENNEITSSKFENFKFKEKVTDGFIYENSKGEILFIDGNDAKVYKVSTEIKVQFDQSGYEIEKIISEK